MKNRLLLLVIMVCCLTSVAAKQKVDRPKLVVGIVVDQMRWDYLYYYYEEYRNDGLKRLLDDGFSRENNMINYVPTVTAIGHSSTWTGSVPSITGIAGNSFKIDGKDVSSVTDNTVQAVGIDPEAKVGKCSPRNLLCGTIGDALKIATDFKSKVIGVALKDRAAILPAGHGADAAYWWDGKRNQFITSTYYMDKLPQWVNTFNRTNKQKEGTDVFNDPVGVSLTFKLAEDAISHEGLGRDDITDLLAISISSTDAIGHKYSTRGKENHDVYMRLDRDIAHFLTKLDQSVGNGNYLVFLTADHGAIHNPNFSKDHKIPSSGWDATPTRQALQEGLSAKFGNVDGKYIKSIMDMRIYLDDELIAKQGIDFDAVKQEAVRILKKDPQFLYVFDYENVMSESIPAILRERIINGYHRGRSGDIGVMLRANMMHGKADEYYKGTTHGNWSPEDAHIPLLFMGWHVNKGTTDTPVRIVDIAPTVCAMIHIQMPNGCIGDAIQEVYR